VKKAAYLQGMVDGLGIDESTNEGKIIRAMSELLVEMSEELSRLDDDIDDVCNDIDEMDNDIDLIRSFLLDEEDDEDEDDDTDEPCYEVECPHCGETVYVTEADLEEKEAFCASCGKSFSIELAEEEYEPDELDDEDDDEPIQYEITCPNCGAVTVVDEEALDEDELHCSKCGASLEIEVEDEDDEDEE
jgi:transcription elongation factor Elf1